MKGDGGWHYKLLTRNMILTVIIISLSPMILMIGILLYQFNISYHEKTYAHLRELVGKHKQKIDTFLNEKLADIQYLSPHTIAELNGDPALKQKLGELKAQYGDVFVDLGLVDMSGKQIAYAGPYELYNVHSGDSSWFKTRWVTS